MIFRVEIGIKANLKMRKQLLFFATHLGANFDLEIAPSMVDW